MQVVVVMLTGPVVPLDVTPDTTVARLKALIGSRQNVDPATLRINRAMEALTDDNATLASLHINHGDILIAQTVAGASGSSARQRQPQQPGAVPQIDWGAVHVPPQAAAARPSRDRADEVRSQILADPYLRSALKQNNPELSEALESNDAERFAAVWRQQEQLRQEKEAEERAIRDAIRANPDSAEARARLAELERMRKVDSNLAYAMEHSPESFGRVVMLYIDVKVNGVPVKAFVDSGAQMTIVSEECARRTGLLELLDTRWHGTAVGVGTGRILGRVHAAALEVAGAFFDCTFNVMEKQGVDMLLGLDMLKRHQCVIDLRNNVLRIGTTMAETPFLAEKDLPESAKGELAAPAPEPDEASSSTAGGTASGPAAPAPSSSSSSTQSAVEALTAMGFPAELCERALEMAGGDVEAAASYLFSMMHD